MNSLQRYRPNLERFWKCVPKLAENHYLCTTKSVQNKRDTYRYGKEIQTYHRDIGPALCQRTCSYRTPGRSLCTGRHLRALSATQEGRRHLHRRKRRARSAHHHPRPQGGMHAAGHRRPLPHAHPRLVQGVRHLVRRLRTYLFGSSPPDGLRLLPQALRQGRIHRKDLHAILRRGSQDLPGRPLHHRRMPALPRRRRLWRPVREVRLHTESHGAHQPQERHQRQQARDEGNQALVPPAGQARRLAAPVDSGGAQGMAPQRLRPVQVVARHGIAAACREPRPGLGHPRARRGSRGQGALRMVRRPHRLHQQHQGTAARLVGEVVERPRDAPRPLHRQGQHRVPLHRLPRHAEGRRLVHPA